jgi:hypothetical protein
MAFIHVSGPARAETFKKTASVAIAVNTPVAFDGSAGFVRQAAVASTRIAGISLRKVASTDDDYADNSDLVVVIPSEDDIFEADVTGTATQANVGEQYDLSTLTDGTAQNVNVSGTTYKVVTVVGFISASKVLVKFNGNYAYANKDN